MSLFSVEVVGGDIIIFCNGGNDAALKADTHSL